MYQKRKTHILIECPYLIASVRVGVIEPLRYFTDHDLCEVKFKETMQIKAEDIAWSDVIFCVRGFGKQTYDIMKVAKKYHRKIIYFLDDDLLDLPQNIGSSDLSTRTLISEYLLKTIKISDKLMVVNRLIGEKYSALSGTPYFISGVPCTIDIDENKCKKNNENIKILYAGSTDHTDQVRKFVIPALIKILDEHNDVEATFVGVNPGVVHKQIKCYKFFENYNEYKAAVEKENFDIGLAIIGESQFYRSKYYNKYIEYTSIGAVGIYTDTEPYSLIIKDGENGMLCMNNVDAWYETINKTINNGDNRKKMLLCAQQNLKNNFNYKRIADDILINIPWLLSYHISINDLHDIKADYHAAGTMSFYYDKAIICLKHDGIKAIPFLICKTMEIIILKLLRRT